MVKKVDGKSKKKKTKRMAPNAVAAAMKGKHTAPSKENPFEAIWSRRKFDILGKKRRGEERRIGQARSRAVDKRKNTLLKEYEQSRKSSVFVDKRIGESNDQLGDFDKAIMRSQRERQLKLGKVNKFNDDGEDDDLGLSSLDFLSEKDDFEEEGQLIEEEDDEYNTKKNEKQNSEDAEVSLDGQAKHKTKKEVMAEIIMKSKFFKAQKAKEKEENEQLMEKLDKSFVSLLDSRVLLNDSAKKNEPLGDFQQDKADYYDKMFKEMTLDMRAKPSDRTKTPEEIAFEEKERLEKLEEERKKRMTATDDSSDEDNDETKKQPRSFSGDDLNDSFSHPEESPPKKGWVDQILERENSVDSDSDESNSASDKEDNEDNEDDEDIEDNEGDEDDEVYEDEKSSLKDWEQSDEEEGISPIKEAQQCTKQSRENAPLDKSVPFVIEAPKTFEELRSLVENRSNSDVIVIINRIRTCNAIKISADNRKKIQIFYGVLLQYFAVLAAAKPLNFELLNSLVKPLIELSTEIPYFSAICARHRIARMRSQFCEAIKNPGNSGWPSFKTLSLLRLWFIMFPSSDFRHCVITPATLFICEHLMRCRIASLRDIAIGSFLCRMILSVSKQSKKFFPEAIVFIRAMLTTENRGNDCNWIGCEGARSMLRLGSKVDEIEPLDLLMVVETAEDSAVSQSNEMRASVLNTLVVTLEGFVEAWKDLASFPEVFSLLASSLFDWSEDENLPDSLRQKLRHVRCLVTAKSEECERSRRPLQLQKQRPVPIKMLTPQYEENFVKGRDYDPDRERAERKKMKKMVAREAKGAARELRKDNMFLMEVKEKERATFVEEKMERYGKTKAFLQEQEHAFKSGQLGKGRKRRR